MTEDTFTDHRAGKLDVERRMRRQMERLYPICRSITGDGVRETLDIIGEAVPLVRHEVPSGTQVFDWTVNDEWSARDAYIADLNGKRLVDFRAHNLHLVGYSTPMRARMSMVELRPHLFTLPEHPTWIPYRTTYYNRTWGFCLSHDQLSTLGPGPFDVVVDTSLSPGSLSYGELVVPGDSEAEVLVSAHVCHPSIANDNLSGIAVATELAAAIRDTTPRRWTYRFLFAPGTIGSLTWLSRNTELLPRIKAGLVLTGLGGPGPLVYKATRRGDRWIDRVATHVTRRRGGEVRAYSPYGYDERQFNAVGFDLPVGRLSRTPHGEYAEYHTSADDLGLVSNEHLSEALTALLDIVAVFEQDDVFDNLSPFGEPQLGKHGLYPTMGGKAASEAVMAMLWTLAYSDGSASLLDVAEVAGISFAAVHEAAIKLEDARLLRRTKG